MVRWGCAPHASGLVLVFSEDQHQGRCSFTGDPPQFWNETQARGLLEGLLDRSVGISWPIRKGRNGEAIWGCLGAC